MNRKNGEEKVKLSRISRIDDELRSGRYPNAEKLAAKMEVSPRTILRDIKYLRNSYDAPIGYDHVNRGFYYTEPNFFIKSVLLTEDEIGIITAYDEYLQLKNDDEFEMKLGKAIEKILAIEPENQSSETNISESMFTPNIEYDGELIHKLSSAVQNKEVIEVEYWVSENRKYTLLTLKPLYIFYERHFYYLLALNKDNHKKPGVYAIYNFQKLCLTGKHFTVPADFKFLDYVKKGTDVSPADNKLYLFELSFSKKIASKAIEKTYYPNQTIKMCEDGTVLVAFRSNDIYEVFDWVLGQGHKVKVLNPPKLVEMVKNEMQKIGQYYV